MADGYAQWGYAPALAAAVTADSTLPAARPIVATTDGKTVAGLPTARFDGPSSGAAWLVRRITVSAPGTATKPRAFIYVGEAQPENLVMGTNSGTFDYTTEDPPLYVPDGQPLVVQWDAGPTRTIARIEYQEI